MREAIINEMTAVSDYIFRHPELSLNEYKSSGALADFLEKEGFRITWRLAGFETAFLAEWTVSGGGPVIGFLAELFYDEMAKIPAPAYTAEELEFAAKISAEAEFDNKGEYFTGLEPLEDRPVPLAIGTDVSDVSHTVPTIMLSAAAMCKGTPLHHWAATAQAGMSIGRKGMVYAAECMAAGAYRLVKEPELLRQAWREFRGQE